MAEETFYDTLNRVVQHIFSNWTGLKLAVEHSMGGPNSKQLAIDCIGEVTQFCMEDPNVDQESLEDFLEDIMDENFDTIFEDGSIKEISTIILQFVQLLKNGDTQQCQTEFLKLPMADGTWLQQSKISNQHQNDQQRDSSSEEEDAHPSSETPMEDDGWTVVQTKKKR